MPEPGRSGPKGPGQRPLLRALLGRVLRRTRLAQGRTLADVARVAQVSVPYLSELERGRKEASSEVLAAVCEALRIDLSGLLAEAGRDLAQISTGWPLAGAGQGQVIRLGAIRSRPAGQRAGGHGDVMCRLAA